MGEHVGKKLVYILFSLLFCLNACGTAQKDIKTPELEMVEAKFAKSITRMEKGSVLVNQTDSFVTEDDQAISYVKFSNLSGSHDIRWEWYTPEGKLYYATKNIRLAASRGKFAEGATAWHKIAIKGDEAQNYPGTWKVRVWMDDAPLATKTFEIKTIAQAGLPPILAIEEISLSNPLLGAGETVQLTVTVKNSGPGDANDLFLELYSDTEGLVFESKKDLPLLPKKKGVHTVSVPIEGDMELPSGEASIDIQLVEPHFGVKIKGKRLSFNTVKFRYPELILARFAASESESSYANQQIDVNEILDLKIAVQNVGQGAATDVKIEVVNQQAGVMFLGRGEGQDLRQDPAVFEVIEPGKFRIVNYRYFVNSNFKEDELAFTISAAEQHGKFGFSEAKPIKINTKLEAEGYIRKVAVAKSAATGAVVIEDIPDLEIDVDVKIPKTGMSNPDAIAVVLGNRNYLHKDLPPVQFARHDAEIMRRYLINTLGFKEGNVLFETDAAKTRFEALFGIAGNHRGILHDYIKPGKSDVFIFYSGHGAPDLHSMKGYFVPVDCDPAKISLTGYALDTFYDNLAKMPARKITVVLDACFSGGTNSGRHLMGSASPALIKVDDSIFKKGHAAVLTSSEGDQISSWYDQKQHGLFTYFFLKALGGAADKDQDRQITFQEIYDYVSDRSEGVPYWSRRLHGGRIQMPTLRGTRNAETLVDLR